MAYNYSNTSRVGPNGFKNGQEWFQLYLHLTLVSHDKITGPDRHGMVWLSNKNGLAWRWK